MSKGILSFVEQNELDFSAPLTERHLVEFFVRTCVVPMRTVGEGYFVKTPKGVPLGWVPPNRVPLWTEERIQAEIDRRMEGGGDKYA